MAESLELVVSTPTGLALQTSVESVQSPSAFGEFGVLPNHLPLLAANRCGVLRYIKDGHEHYAAIGPGFIEAEPDRVRVLTDMFARPEDIDLAEVQKEQEAAEEALKKFPHLYEGPEYRELQRNVDWALARIEVASLADR